MSKIFEQMKRRGVTLSANRRASFYDRLENRLFDLAVRQGCPRLHEESLAAHAKAEEIRSHDSHNPHMG